MTWVSCRDALGGFPQRTQVKFWFDHCIRTQVFTWSWIANKQTKKNHNSRIRVWIISSSCLVLGSFVFSCSIKEIEKLRLYKHLWCSGITTVVPRLRSLPKVCELWFWTLLFSQTVTYLTKDYKSIPATYSVTLLRQSPTGHESVLLYYGEGSNSMTGLNWVTS